MKIRYSALYQSLVTSKSTEGLVILIIHLVIIGMRICVETAEEGHKGEKLRDK